MICRSPQEHTKGKQESNAGRVLETKAAYWEPRIKTYGFQTVTGLSLLQLTAPLSSVTALGLALVRFGEEGFGFHLVFSRSTSEGMELSLLLSSEQEERIARGLRSLASPGGTIPRVSPAELVLFHGPHFGDRYGIFHAAARALAARGVAMLAYACSGSSVHIVVSRGRSGEAVEALSDAFVVPRRQAGRT